MFLNSPLSLSLIRTIRGGGFSPLSLSPVAWYDFSDLTTLFQDSAATTPVTVDGDVIGYAGDKSGNGNHATQATTANKPLYRTGGLIECDGVNDYLLTTFLPTAAGTLAARFNADVAASLDKIIGGGDGAGNRRAYISIHSDGFFSGGVGTQTSTIIRASPDIRGTTGVGIMTYNGTTVKLYWQGTEIYSAAQSGSPSGSTSELGIATWNNGDVPADFFPGDIYDVLVIDRALTPTEVTNLTTYWNA